MLVRGRRWCGGGVLRSLGRLPASRVVRIGILAVAAGTFGSLTITASPLFALLLLGTIFVIGLESIEALSQEVDRADRTDGLPIERGWIYANHLVAPAILLVVIGLVSATTASILDPTHAVGRVRHRRARALGWSVGAGGRHRQRCTARRRSRHHDADGSAA